MAKVTKTAVRRELRTIRRDAGWLNTCLDVYGLDQMRNDPRLTDRIEDALNVIEGTAALLREMLLDEGAGQ